MMPARMRWRSSSVTEADSVRDGRAGRESSSSVEEAMDVIFV
jgi:hypothetical protein